MYDSLNSEKQFRSKSLFPQQEQLGFAKYDATEHDTALMEHRMSLRILRKRILDNPKSTFGAHIDGRVFIICKKSKEIQTVKPLEAESNSPRVIRAVDLVPSLESTDKYKTRFIVYATKTSGAFSRVAI